MRCVWGAHGAPPAGFLPSLRRVSGISAFSGGVPFHSGGAQGRLVHSGWVAPQSAGICALPA
eukprot:3741814-Lingulodinium_polyedra.AAC.1